MTPRTSVLVLGASLLVLLVASGFAAAHGVADGDKQFIVNNPASSRSSSRPPTET